MEWRLKAGEGKEETGRGRPVVGESVKWRETEEEAGKERRGGKVRRSGQYRGRQLCIEHAYPELTSFTLLPLYMHPFLPDVSVSNKVTLSPFPLGSWLTPISLGISLLTRLVQGQLGTSPQWAEGEDFYFYFYFTVEKMLSPHPLGAGTHVPATAGIYVSLTKEILETKPMQERLPGTSFSSGLLLR